MDDKPQWSSGRQKDSKVLEYKCEGLTSVPIANFEIRFLTPDVGNGCGWRAARLSLQRRGSFLPSGCPNYYSPAMSTFEVSTDKETQLAQRMASLGVRETDIAESFVRSGGHGGQNVNKVATCVMLLHRPSGVQVKCQETRQQGLNRFLARKLLLDKIESMRKERVAAERARVEKARRQKLRRSRGAKERMLANKSRHSAKKEFRKRVSLE
jgi:peptide chain release factor